MALQLLKDWLLDPLALLFIATCVGFLWSLRLGGWLRWYLLGLIAAFQFVSAPIIVNPMLGVLEGRYTQGESCAAASPDHIIVLGGGVSSAIRNVDEYERMYPPTLARVAAAARLAREWPGSRLILAGGGPQAVSEAEVMAHFLEREGIARERMVLESRSQSTSGNAREVVALLAADKATHGGGGNHDVLVTSARHLPRVMLHFREQGLDPCPFGVDYLAVPDIPVWAWMPQVTALDKFNVLLHEVVGLAAARLGFSI